FFSSRRRHTRLQGDWSSDVCSSDLNGEMMALRGKLEAARKNFEEKLRAVDAELDGVFGQWDAALDTGADDAARKKLMTRMNELLNRRSYIRNLAANVQKELAEA